MNIIIVCCCLYVPVEIVFECVFGDERRKREGRERKRCRKRTRQEERERERDREIDGKRERKRDRGKEEREREKENKKSSEECKKARRKMRCDDDKEASNVVSSHSCSPSHSIALSPHLFFHPSSLCVVLTPIAYVPQ